MKNPGSINIKSSPSQRISQIPGLEEGLRKYKAPSIYYRMLDVDSVIYESGFGLRHIEENLPPTPGTQYAIFSVTKTFTATAIFLLEEQGRLKIDDLASNYLVGYDFLEGVTIRQLLCHQSGLNNPFPLKWIHLAEADDDFDYSNFSKQVLQTKAKRKRRPGSKAAYSNLNFLLLGEIIEAVVRMDYQSFIMERVIRNVPGIAFKWNAENVAFGYHAGRFSSFVLGLLMDKKKFTGKKVGKYLPFRRNYVNGPAYGGLIASPHGLSLYLQKLLDPSCPILTESSKKRMFEPQVLINGKPSGFTLGWFVGRLGENDYVCHAGGGGGYYCEMRLYPKLQKASFILTNQSGFTDRRVLDDFDPFLLDQ